MTRSRLPEYLDQILDAANLACNYVEGMSPADFLDDRKTQQAVILNLLVIGEAASRILRDHPEFADLHAHIPWKGIKGMRNRIAHGYFDINLEIVWDTVCSSLPELRQNLGKLRATLPHS